MYGRIVFAFWGKNIDRKARKIKKLFQHLPEFSAKNRKRKKDETMLTRLTCHVTNCASNQNNCCCQPSIKVQGKGACHCGETECQSFQKKGPGEVSNSTHFTNANLNAQVKCTAENCVFNSMGNCNADHISIGGNGAESRSQTNCESFQAR